VFIPIDTNHGIITEETLSTIVINNSCSVMMYCDDSIASDYSLQVAARKVYKQVDGKLKYMCVF